MKLKALEGRVESPRYKTGYTRLEKAGIYMQAALASAVLAVISMYVSCAGDVSAGQAKIENVQESRLEIELQ